MVEGGAINFRLEAVRSQALGARRTSIITIEVYFIGDISIGDALNIAEILKLHRHKNKYVNTHDTHVGLLSFVSRFGDRLDCAHLAWIL